MAKLGFTKLGLKPNTEYEIFIQLGSGGGGAPFCLISNDTTSVPFSCETLTVQVRSVVPVLGVVVNWYTYVPLLDDCAYGALNQVQDSSNINSL